MTLTLTELHIYPIKSAAGIDLSQATVQPRGLEYDRRWMVVDANGKFMTQRKFPQMARIQVQLGDRDLCISAPGIQDLSVPLQSYSGHDSVIVDVWGDRCAAIPVGPESRAWFTQVLATDCQLVYMPDGSDRPTDHGKLGPEQQVSFADAYPFLLISEASLADLNSRLDEPIPMNRFRPNLVVAGCDAFAEDQWDVIQIGSLSFNVAKACARCTIPTVDQATGIRGKEPLTTLASYRRWDGQIWFGQNLVQVGDEVGAKQGGELRVGDRITLL
ncbi:MAG: MOSC domain-containing protein [Cyanothece sp. SIO2G6]|nr:MOSC domain-containing protein [Cyanothece sp. SIO2G6]